MSKEIKKLMIDALAKRFKDINECVVIDISTFDSQENYDFRTAMRESEIEVSGVKTTLARQAVDGSQIQPIADILKGQSYITTGGADVITLAKALVKWAKDNEKMVIKGGVYEGQLLDMQAILALSKMPSREEILAGIVVLSLSPGQTLVSQVKQPASQILGAIESLVKKLEKD